MSLNINTDINRAASIPSRPSSVIKRSEPFPQQQAWADVAMVVNDAAAPETASVVTGEERQFFASMFPNASEAIQSYSGYSPAGMKRPVQLGTLIDMKG